MIQLRVAIRISSKVRGVRPRGVLVAPFEADLGESSPSEDAINRPRQLAEHWRDGSDFFFGFVPRGNGDYGRIEGRFAGTRLGGAMVG